MIYVTGDTHGSYDIKKLNTAKFPEQKKMKKNDYVIICGDFGCVWDNGKEDLYWRKWLKSKRFTTLFVDGNHENFQLLKQYDVETWNGGKVQFINDSIIHLMRGQVYIIDGIKFFTMGGGESIDKRFRVEGKSWWPEEAPSDEEFDEAVINLSDNDWKVDYVITHTASMKMMEQMCYIKENTPLNSIFDLLEKDLCFKHWYFGHFHSDENLDEKHTLVYDKIIRLL